MHLPTALTTGAGWFFFWDASEILRLGVAVWTEEPEIASQVVQSVAIFMINLQYKRFPTPLRKPTLYATVLYSNF
jgi:hypothetical protein